MSRVSLLFTPLKAMSILIVSPTVCIHRNPNAKTIEGELFKAMVAADAVSKDNADDIKKVLLRTLEKKPVHCLY